MIVLEWINNQLLRMEWLSNLVTFLVEQGLGLSVKENLGGSIHFFIYDVIKIFILLSVLIFGISYVQSFFPPERTRKILGRFSGLFANILAALLGTVADDWNGLRGLDNCHWAMLIPQSNRTPNWCLTHYNQTIAPVNAARMALR